MSTSYVRVTIFCQIEIWFEETDTVQLLYMLAKLEGQVPRLLLWNSNEYLPKEMLGQYEQAGA